MILGIDIGGTFTDFVLVDQAGQTRIHKRLTTPDDPARALLDGVDELGLPPDADIVHGSTIATNALLERKGARTALITTRGFADVLEIGRQTRPLLYDLHPRRPRPLVPADWRFEVTERVTAEGRVITPLILDDLDPIRERLRADGIESLAVCLLFSFLHPDHERAIRDRILDGRADGGLRDRFFISLSCEVLPEFREYERTSTTVINAYVAPLMGRYLARLEAGLAGRRLRIMQSNGGVISAATATAQAARTVLSGPAGGAVGAFHVARLSGYRQIITFDMGGTSTDVALCDGRVPTTNEGEIDGMPLRLPMIDIHTVGAGGGSLAQVDVGGALTVGPQSAGADPGPVCYGRGGRIPTTTDANLILGRLDAAHFLGGAMALDKQGALEALDALARTLGAESPQAAAWDVIRVANATMERAMRRISVERGHDPRRFALLAFGGAGPLHACDLAAALQIPTVLVPRTPGVLSALGMLVADLVKDYSRTVMLQTDGLRWSDLERAFRPLEVRGQRELQAQGVQPGAVALSRALDMRYVGQSHELTVPVETGDDFLAAFHGAHQRRFGHRHPDEPVEIVNLRVVARGGMTKPSFRAQAPGETDPSAARWGKKAVYFGARSSLETPLYRRERLRAGHLLEGPAVVFQLDTTTVIPPGWRARVDRYGTLVIAREGAPDSTVASTDPSAA